MKYPIPPAIFRKLFITTLIVLVIHIAANSNAATQGKWGRTSTASANITLIIPPKNDSAEALATIPRNGFQALKRFCQFKQSTNGDGLLVNGYQISIIGQAGSLHSVTSEHCTTGSNTNLSTQSGISTILVAPI